MNEAALAAALRLIGQGFMQLATALDNVQETDAPSLHAAVKQQKSVTDTRAGRAPADEGDARVVNISAAKEKTASAATEKEAYPAKALAALAKLDLAEATRPELKEVAEALGIYQQGAKASDMREALGKIRASNNSGKSAAAPAEAVAYPDKPTMRKEFKLFCKVNKDAIEEENPEFFDEDSDGDNPEDRLHQILTDDTALKANWKDNVFDLKQRGEWDDLLKEAEGAVQ